MANTHPKGKVAGAFGHDGGSEDSYEFRGRNAGGTLHRRGEKKGARQAPPTVAKAVVVHVEQQATALRARVDVAVEHADARGQAARAAEADRRLWALQNIRHLPPIEEREAHIARLFATYKG